MKSLEGHTSPRYLKMIDGAAMVYNLFAQTKRFAQNSATFISQYIFFAQANQPIGSSLMYIYVWARN